MFNIDSKYLEIVFTLLGSLSNSNLFESTPASGTIQGRAFDYLIVAFLGVISFS